jgi:hypothetical protein
MSDLPTFLNSLVRQVIVKEIVSQNMEEKNKECDEEVVKLEQKYKIEDEIKKDDKDKKKSERIKNMEREKAKIREKSNKITEGDLMKVLEFLNPKEKPKITEVRDMIWVKQLFIIDRKWMRIWISPLIQ